MMFIAIILAKFCTILEFTLIYFRYYHYPYNKVIVGGIVLGLQQDSSGSAWDSVPHYPSIYIRNPVTFMIFLQTFISQYSKVELMGVTHCLVYHKMSK